MAIGIASLSGFGFGLAALAVTAGLLALARARSEVSFTFVGIILFASVGGALLARSTADGGPTYWAHGDFQGTIRVVNGPYLTASGQRLTAEAGDSTPGTLCVYLPSAPRPRAGDLLSVRGVVTLPKDLSQIGRAALQARDCDAQLWAGQFAIVERGTGVRSILSGVRLTLSDVLMRSAPGDTGALMSGLVTGDDGALSEESRAAFLGTGTTHITAISGANFAVLMLLLGVMASGAMRRSTWFVVAGTGLIWAYAFMVGLQPSVFRAALLATAVLIGRMIGRLPDLLTLTLLLASFQILVRPNDFQTLAFQLSLAATIALIVVFDGSERQGARGALITVGLSVLAAQLATIPVLAARIGSISLTSLIANLVVAPLANLAFPFALIGSLPAVASDAIGVPTLAPASLFSWLMVELVVLLERALPGTVVLGHPTRGALVTIGLICWTTVFWMSGDLRRMARYGLNWIKAW
ncbi:MAG: ComEC/Rec2 family competence protein [Thermomicrobiales bacterium]|nr:ComEC/Rec2 family competence protein [Thermomicrobiales bacterium]